MRTGNILTVSLVFLTSLFFCQEVAGIYRTQDLLKRISHPDTLYVVNFWATWCKPCIEELPSFDSLQAAHTQRPLKILLVSLDFKEDMETRVNPFLKRKKILAECVLLDETNGNDFIDLIHTGWSGAIPATLFVRDRKKTIVEKKLALTLLEKQISEFNKQ